MIELQNEQHGFAIAVAAASLFNPLYDVVISNEKDGRLLGGVFYYDFTGKVISMHVAGFDPRWLCKNLLWVVFHYAFVQLECSSIFCQIRSTNSKALKLAEDIGFNRELIIPEVFPDADSVIHRMRKKDCRWLSLAPRGITFKGNLEPRS